MKCEFCDSVIKTVPDNGICPNCGGVLPLHRSWSASKQATTGTGWPKGMPCPRCGAANIEGKKCSFCGAQLIEDRLWSKNTKKGSTQIPTSSGYLGVGSSLVLSDSGLSICVNRLFNKHRTQISYDELTSVVYLRPTKSGNRTGALLFRGRCNKHDPIPNRDRLHIDRSAITLSQETDTLFYHIYQMLKTVAPATTRFESIILSENDPGLDDVAKEIDMDYFFDMYAPHRERAASAIRTKHGISLEKARELVDRDFDARQEKQYAADPLDAIRDLNLVVEDMRRKNRWDNQIDAQRRKRMEKEAIISGLEKLK